MREVVATLLGLAQDGGFPQPGCNRGCCAGAWGKPTAKLSPVALGIVGIDGSAHLFEATRDMGRQFEIWFQENQSCSPLSSLCLTHAHLGHIDGLGLFGREVMGSKDLQLFCSQSVSDLIDETPAWKLLLEQGVIKPVVWRPMEPFAPSPDCGFTITAVPVPHRSELSDNHALIVSGTKQNLLFMPDHDDWGLTLGSHNASSIREWLHTLDIDIALIDGTFWNLDELPHRDISEIPHPTISETIDRLGVRLEGDPDIQFIHLNHTNPVLNQKSTQFQQLSELGWKRSSEGENWSL